MSREAPEFYTCPISLEIMTDPVILAVDGHSYERQYISKCTLSPLTKQSFDPQKDLIPNRALKNAIEEWVKQSNEQTQSHATAALATSQRASAAAAANLFKAAPAASSGARPAAEGHRIADDEINQTLQRVVYGEEGVVKDRLEALKNNPVKLSQLLSVTGTVLDYSHRTITGMTLLQAAAAAGDVDMCLMLKNYMSSEEFATQLAEIFPEGIEAHEASLQRNTFNFDAILAAIRAANTPDLYAALNKIDNGAALCRALEEFRRQFTEISNREKIFNPQHLLRAFEVYNALWDQCERDGSDRGHEKCNLFWRQIIGYTQRFMPACYAQAFAQGLYYLVKVDQDASWRPEPFNRALKLKYDNFSYFPLPLDSRSGLGFDFAIYVPGWVGGWRLACTCGLPLRPAFFQELLSSKNSWLSEHYAASSSAVARPV